MPYRTSHDHTDRTRYDTSKVCRCVDRCACARCVSVCERGGFLIIYTTYHACSHSPGYIRVCGPRRLGALWRAANNDGSRHTITNRHAQPQATSKQPLYSQFGPHVARPRGPAHGHAARAWPAWPTPVTAPWLEPWLWPMQMRGRPGISGSEQVLYAYGPPHGVRDALVVFIAHLCRGGLHSARAGEGGSG